MNREFKLSNLIRRNNQESNRDLIEEAGRYLRANQPPEPYAQATRSATFPPYPASAPEEPAKPSIPASKEPPKPQKDSGPVLSIFMRTLHFELVKFHASMLMSI